MSEKLLTVEEVAEVLRVHPGSVRRWLSKSEMRGLKLGKNWRVPESALTEFMAKASNLEPEQTA